MLFTLLGLGIFLIGAMAFAIDISNLWFNRQAAQTAADAACTAGAMDLLVDATNGTVNQGGFNTSTSANPFDCSTSQTPAPCQYATLNGFGSSIASGSTALGNNVSFDWSPRDSGAGRSYRSASHDCARSFHAGHRHRQHSHLLCRDAERNEQSKVSARLRYAVYRSLPLQFQFWCWIRTARSRLRSSPPSTSREMGRYRSSVAPAEAFKLTPRQTLGPVDKATAR